MTAPSKKRRVTYPKDLRAIAKGKQHGLCTVAIEFPDGTWVEHQDTVDVLQCQFAKWAMALLFAEGISRPDLERVVKELCTRKPETTSET